MRRLPSPLQDKLSSGVTTLCRCFVLTRRDGLVQGFTDHDNDILLDGIVCRAGAGLSASEASARLGLSVDGAEISGALSDDSLGEAALAAGHYDAAVIETWLVDWSEPSLRLLMHKATLGEVRREGAAFVAEMRSLSDKLAQETGRLFTASCAADLGDARCGIDLDDPVYRGGGEVVRLRSVSGFVVAGLDAFADGWFDAGRLTFASGANAGLAMEVKRHSRNNGEVTLDLWQAMPEPIAPGDAFVVTAGCDKRFATCRARFANAVNFRGFPHIPGNDFILRYAIEGESGHDGSSLQKS